MGKEIERKFLVVSDDWREGAVGTLFKQGYLSRDPGHTVRVRLAGEQGFLTVKGRRRGLTKAEYEYAIPGGDAIELLRMCGQPLIEKVRYRVPHAGKVWEVDEFSGANAGLVVAEIELQAETELFELPPWVGQEVSQDKRYYNSQLGVRPYSVWGAGEGLMADG